MNTQQLFMLITRYRVRFHTRRSLACLFALLLSVALTFGPKSRAFSQVVQKHRTNYRAPQRGSEVLWLEEGKPFERKLAGGESHSYQLNLTAGQYARVIVEQKGIDVVVSVFGPDGKLITAVDSPNGSIGAEPVHITA